MRENKTAMKRYVVRNRQKRELFWCYAFLMPTIVMYICFTAWPVIFSWYYAFLDWSGFTSDRKFVGWLNFKEVLHDTWFWNAFKNSFVYMLGVVPAELILALIVAMVLNNPRLKLASIYRMLFFLPVVTTTAIVGVIMNFIWGPVNGPINLVLQKIGLISQPINFLSNVSTVMLVVIIIGIWKGMGINMVYWLAGLQTIPKDLYEAAEIDGANKFHILWHIVFPLLIPIAAVITLLGVIQSLKVFDLIKTLTEGGPYFATDVMGTYLYRMVFSVEIGVPRLGYASAAGIIFGLTTMLMALVQVAIIRKYRGKPGEGGSEHGK